VGSKNKEYLMEIFEAAYCGYLRDCEDLDTLVEIFGPARILIHIVEIFGIVRMSTH
jgi:hypothetical protein